MGFFSGTGGAVQERAVFMPFPDPSGSSGEGGKQGRQEETESQPGTKSTDKASSPFRMTKVPRTALAPGVYVS